MPNVLRYRRFTVSLDERDYKALRKLGESQKPPLNLQYLVRLAVRNLLDQHAGEQPSKPLIR
jgi:hypothetical protein